MYYPFQTPDFLSYRGIVQELVPVNYNASSGGCYEMVSLQTEDQGIINFILGPDTYLSSRIPIEPGMELVGFYDSSLPVPLIYPPQFQAVILAFPEENQQVYVGYFDHRLQARDGSLRLNPGPNTEIFTENGQIFQGALGNRLLLVFYSITTRSIPPQTPPEKIIVMCSL